jgi:hypothetical protein
MGHDKLGNYFKSNFSLMQHHHWSLSEIEAMLPWERYVYMEMLLAYLAEQEKLAKQREQEEKSRIQQMMRQQRR